MNGYPLLLDVTDRRVLVVGGGPVAARLCGSFAPCASPSENTAC